MIRNIVVQEEFDLEQLLRVNTLWRLLNIDDIGPISHGHDKIQ